MDHNTHVASAFDKSVGILFAFAVFGLVAYTVVYEVDLAGPKGRMLFILVAVAVGGIFAVVPGFLNVSYTRAGVAVRAAGGAAAFAGVLYLGQTWAEAEQQPAPPSVQPAPDWASAPAPAPAPDRTPAPAADDTAALPDWLRQVIEAPVAQIYRAEAVCPMTGASGWSTAADPWTAQTQAVQYCVLYGGVPDCCAANVSLTQ